MVGIKNKTKLSVNLFFSIFIVQFIQSIVVVMLMNAQLNWIPGMKNLSKNYLPQDFGNGSYRDFTKDWFMDIGSVYVIRMATLVLTSLINFVVE